MSGAEPTSFNDITGIFFQDGYRLARQHTDGGIHREAITGMMMAAYESIDSLIGSFRQRCRLENIAVDCHEGCAFCCHQAVLASNHEVLLIWQFIAEELEPQQKNRFRKRAGEKHDRTSGMTAMEFLHYIHPCPFLQDGSCRIYPVRPMACRCYLSSSRESCLRQYENPEDRSRIAALFDFPLKAGRGMNEGIRSALMEKGLKPSEWLLEAFMARLFEDAGLTDDWLNGGTPFQIRKLTAEENRYFRDYYPSD
jgi:Fe-S-cluster containining protein